MHEWFEAYFGEFSKFFQGEKKISPRLPPRRKSCRCLITACSRENLPKNMLRVGTIIRHSRVLKTSSFMIGTWSFPVFVHRWYQTILQPNRGHLQKWCHPIVHGFHEKYQAYLPKKWMLPWNLQSLISLLVKMSTFEIKWNFFADFLTLCCYLRKRK